jgi:hypothetical protein
LEFVTRYSISNKIATDFWSIISMEWIDTGI